MRLRLFWAAVLVAIISVGAPLHSHDIAFDGDQASPRKSGCAACVTSASPGLVLEHTDVVPILEAIEIITVPAIAVVPHSLPVRSGRAPPAL